MSQTITESPTAADRIRPRADYMIQLDGIRAIAICAVLADHWSLGAVSGILPLGLLGVRLFFVLSGFLITGILLKTRARAETGKHTIAYGLRHFYIRRSLRIFPIYYLTIAVTCLVVPQVILPSIGWHLTYTTNFYVARYDTWVHPVGHFWSLAIEEQFYLLWPWLILFCPRSLLLWIVGGVIFMAPLYRLIAALMGLNPLAITVVTPSGLDALGLGAFLALFDQTPALSDIKTKIATPMFVAGAISLAIMLLMQKFGVGDIFRKVFWYFAAAMIFYTVVDKAAVGFAGLTGRILQSGPLVWIGKVSYGLYVYHPLINDRIDHWVTGPSVPNIAIVGLKAAATFLTAAVSWQLIEKPPNNLKRYFSY